jgi:hypothetical protein
MGEDDSTYRAILSEFLFVALSLRVPDLPYGCRLSSLTHGGSSERTNGQEAEAFAFQSS